MGRTKQTSIVEQIMEPGELLARQKKKPKVQTEVLFVRLPADIIARAFKFLPVEYRKNKVSLVTYALAKMIELGEKGEAKKRTGEKPENG